MLLPSIARIGCSQARTGVGHSAAAQHSRSLGTVSPPDTPPAAAPGLWFLGMLFDADALLSACNGEMEPHGPSALPELLQLVVALWEKVAKFHLTLRITAACNEWPLKKEHLVLLGISIKEK